MQIARNLSARRGAPRRAAAAAELGLVLPLVLLLALVTTDVCRLFYAYILLADCAGSGALYARGNSGMEAASPYYSNADADFTAGTQRAVKAGATDLSPAIQNADITITYATAYNGTYSSTRPTVTTSSDGYVNVTVTWTYTTTISYPGLSSSWAMARTAIMRMVP